MKSFSVMGDSISTFRTVIPPEYETKYPDDEVVSVEQMWWYPLSCKMKLHRVDAYSGARITETGSRPPFSSFVSDFRTSRVSGDVILIFGGTNDFGQTCSPPASFDLFMKEYGRLLDVLSEKHPESRLVAMVPLKREDWGEHEKNSLGWSQLDMREGVKKVVKAHPGVGLIDLSVLDVSGLLSDGLHPNCRGMKVIANLVDSYFFG